MKPSARHSAADVLLKIERDGAYSNIALDAVLKNTDFSEQDNAFFSALVLGVLERKITLDYNISLYLTKNIKKLKPEVLTILRLGAFQLLFMERVPDSAAVNESVSLADSYGASYARGLINAVLRRVSENGLVYPKENEPTFHSVRFSVPDPLHTLLCDSIGAPNTAQFLESTIGSSVTVVRVNTTKTDTETLCAALEKENINAEPHSLIENAVIIRGAGNITALGSFQEGLFHVQDASSQLCVKALSPHPGDTVFDLCASPGGKSFTADQYLQGKGRLFSFDLTENRLSLIKNGAQRLGLNDIECRLNDASVFDPKLPLSDAVLCDVPCSGLGIIGKKPEIRYKPVADFDDLPELQYTILSVSSRYLRAGGTLVYSTCTLNRQENADVVSRFLSENPSFHSEKVFPEFKRNIDDGDFLTLIPPVNACDGFFIAKLKKEYI